MQTEILNWIEESRNLLNELERIINDSDNYALRTWDERWEDNNYNIVNIFNTNEDQQEAHDLQNCKELYAELQKQSIWNGVWELNSEDLYFTYINNDWKNSYLNFYLVDNVLSISVVNTKRDVFNYQELRRIYSDKEFKINGDTTNLLKDVSEAVKCLIDKYSEGDYIPKSYFKQKAYMLYNRYINKLSEEISIAGKWCSIRPCEEFVYKLRFTPDTWSNYEIKFLFNETDSTITYLLQMQRGVEVPSNLAELNEKYTTKYENELMFGGKLKPCDFYPEFEKNVADFIKMVEAGEQIENC